LEYKSKGQTLEPNRDDRLFLKLVAWFASSYVKGFFRSMANQKLGGRAISCGFDGDMLDSIALHFTLARVLFASHLCLG